MASSSTNLPAFESVTELRMFASIRENWKGIKKNGNLLSLSSILQFVSIIKIKYDSIKNIYDPIKPLSIAQKKWI
jgi:hypothetical protein